MPCSTLTPMRSAGTPTCHFRMSTARGDLVVRAFRIGRQADLDFLGDRPDTLDAQGGPLGRRLLGMARDEAGQRDDAVIRSNADMSGIDAWLEFELVDNVLPEL